MSWVFKTTSVRKWSWALVLLSVTAIAFVSRIIGITNGLPMAFHPDEPHILGPVEQFFSGDWNPHDFNYPSLFMYFLHLLLRIFLVCSAWLGGGNLDRNTIYLVGRSVTVLLAVASVIVVYKMGARFISRRSGLVAAFLFAIVPLHNIHSHWVITDIPLTLLILLSLYACTVVAEKGHRRHYLIAGLLCGLSISTKIPGLFVLVSFVFAHLIFVHRSHEMDVRFSIFQRVGCWRKLWPGLLLVVLAGMAALWLFSRPEVLLGFLQSVYPESLMVKYSDKAASTIAAKRFVYMSILSCFVFCLYIFSPVFFRNSKNLILGCALAVIAFFITTPYAILDFKHFSQTFIEQSLVSKTTWGGVFADTLPGWIFNLRILSAGNVFFALLALAGLFMVIREHKILGGILIVFTVTYYFYIGSWGLKFDRYMVPLMPILILFAAVALDKLIAFVGKKQERISRLWKCAIGVFCVAASLSITYQFADECYDYDRYLLKTSTKTLAFNWLAKHLPKDVRILREQYTPELELLGYNVTDVDYKYIDIASPEYVQSNGFDYVIVGSKLFDRPKVARAAKEHRNHYEQLDNYALLIKEIIPELEHPGPLLKIYKINAKK